MIYDRQKVEKVFWFRDFFIFKQGSKLTLANSQNAIDFDNLRVRKMSTRKSLRVRIIHLS